MVKNVLFICLSFLFIGCNANKKTKVVTSQNDVATLLQVDEDFAALSASKGLKEAYLEYIDSNGIILRPNITPMTGADAVDYIIALQDTGYRMIWKPQNAIVASSGDMGYTYGIYQITPQNMDTVLYGSYVNIWKKQDDNKWKFVVQTNNEGIGEINE